MQEFILSLRALNHIFMVAVLSSSSGRRFNIVDYTNKLLNILNKACHNLNEIIIL